jgi:hypothetical protein
VVCAVAYLLRSLTRAAVLAGALIAASAGAARAGDDGAGPLTNGLYPLWEHTAVVHELGAGEVGYRQAQLGLGVAQVGTRPFLDLYGSYNLELKLALPGNETHRTALVVGGYRLPTAAEARGIGELHRTGFSNPYGPLLLVPVTLAHSWLAGERVGLHSAVTALFLFDGQPGGARPSLGGASLLELKAGRGWSARLHAGCWGLYTETQAHAGLSFAYRTQHLQLAAGYARQSSLSGESRGVLLFDGGLVFR